MQVITSKDELREQLDEWRHHQDHIALVATLGNLHAGHLRRPAVDGQILVLYDILDITQGRTPRFVRNFQSGHDSPLGAVQAFVQAVYRSPCTRLVVSKFRVASQSRRRKCSSLRSACRMQVPILFCSNAYQMRSAHRSRARWKCPSSASVRGPR